MCAASMACCCHIVVLNACCELFCRMHGASLCRSAGCFGFVMSCRSSLYIVQQVLAYAKHLTTLLWCHSCIAFVLTACVIHALLVWQHVRTVEPGEQCAGYLDALGNAMLATCRAIPHGVLCFFPSWGLLNAARDQWLVTGEHCALFPYTSRLV